jgi:hypothetical protein
MKRTAALLALATFFTGSFAFAADGSPITNRLQQAMKLYPEADLDKDGQLTMEEALKFLESHPELKAMLAGRGKGKGKAGEGDADRVSGTGPTPAIQPTLADQGPGPRLFVCSHSFMIYTATMLPPMAQAAGLGFQGAGRQMIGGSQVIQHWNIPDEKNRAKTALREGKVDVLTLSPHILLPDQGIDNFTKLGLEKNPNLRVLVQASWPARDGEISPDFHNDKRNAATVDSLHKMMAGHHSAWLTPLEKQVQALNSAVGKEAVHIIPACEAVATLRERLAEGKAPGLTQQTDLFRDDLGHPKAPLAVLVTYCHFATLYGRSPVGLPVPAELKEIPHAEELNKLLQEIAWETVTHYPLSGVKGEVKTAAASAQP